MPQQDAPRDEATRAGLEPYRAATDEVFNQPVELVDFNLFSGDAALRTDSRARGPPGRATRWRTSAPGSARPRRWSLARSPTASPPSSTPTTATAAASILSATIPPITISMRGAIELGLHASPWTDPRLGAHVARAARYYMQTQVEAGHGCPVTMTFAATPCLTEEPALARQWLPKILARVYDPRNVPAAEKRA